MKLMNLTPHSIVFIVGYIEIVVEPSGLVARVSSKTEEIGEIVTPEGTIPVTKTVFGEVETCLRRKMERLILFHRWWQTACLTARMSSSRTSRFVMTRAVSSAACLSARSDWRKNVGRVKRLFPLFFVYLMYSKNKSRYSLPDILSILRCCNLSLNHLVKIFVPVSLLIDDSSG